MRKLATVETIKQIKEHTNADALEIAVVRGWNVIVQKGEFAVGDVCVYFEVDSVLPKEYRYAFLHKYAYNKSLDKYRIKTAKLRGQFSQGLVMPIEQFPELQHVTVGSDIDLRLYGKDGVRINTNASSSGCIIEDNIITLRPESDKGSDLGTSSFYWDHIYSDNYTMRATNRDWTIYGGTNHCIILPTSPGGSVQLGSNSVSAPLLLPHANSFILIG